MFLSSEHGGRRWGPMALRRPHDMIDQVTYLPVGGTAGSASFRYK
jgi:hypothetical protein